jgi:hypothetical protein
MMGVYGLWKIFKRFVIMPVLSPGFKAGAIVISQNWL